MFTKGQIVTVSCCSGDYPMTLRIKLNEYDPEAFEGVSDNEWLADREDGFTAPVSFHPETNSWST